MDIEFIQEDSREDVFKLMELCGIDMAQAYNLYLNSNKHFENALQMHFSKTEQPHQAKFQDQFQPNPPNLGQKSKKSYVPQDFDDLYERYVVYKQSALGFADKYQIRRQEGYLSSFVPSFFKKTQQNPFKKNLQLYIGKSTSLKFCAKSLSQTIEQVCLKEKFPLVIHVVHFNQKQKKNLTSIYKHDVLVDMLNVQFRNYGIDAKSYDVQQDFRQFVDLAIGDLGDHLVIVRVNVLEQVQQLDKIDLRSSTPTQIIQKLKSIKNICINKEMDQVHVQRRMREQLMGNYNYQKPVSTAQKRKIAEDRAIRKKQQQEFHQSMKREQQKRKKSEQIIDKPSSKPFPQNNVPQVKPKKQINYKAEREKIRAKLKIYDSGMMIKLRMPSGESMKLIVSQQQNAQYLYDYVVSREQDLGFEDQINRNFDILRPYDQLNLSQSLNKTLKTIFESSELESLIIRQK